MGVVRIEHRDACATSRVYEFDATRNHRDRPVALDLTIYKVVQHVNDKDSVPSVIVIHVRCDCSFWIVDVDLFRRALSTNSSQEPSQHADPAGMILRSFLIGLNQPGREIWKERPML